MHINKAKSLCKKHSDLHPPDSINLAVAIDHADIFVTEDRNLYDVASEEIETRWIEEL